VVPSIAMTCDRTGFMPELDVSRGMYVIGT
jgi:hypothetical protein